MLKIGLTQRVDVIESYQERRDCLDQAWSDLILSMGWLPLPLPNKAEKKAVCFLEQVDLDGVILTGGNDLDCMQNATNSAPERDGFEHNLISECIAHNVPVLGVCRGMQFLNIYHGGTISNISNHVAVVHSIQSKDQSIMPLADRKCVNSYHNYGIMSDNLPDSICSVALSPDGVIEAIAHKDLPHWGIMWHPERTPQDSRDADLLKNLFQQ